MIVFFRCSRRCFWVHLLVGGSYPLLGLAVQGPLFAGGGGTLYTPGRRRWGERQAVLTLALLMAARRLYFAVPMTESLFFAGDCALRAGVGSAAVGPRAVRVC